MKFYKYPRTPHLPWSPGTTNDDKTLKNTDHFIGKRVVASIKMDGEATTMYPNHIHARSIDSKDHESRHYVKGLHGSIKHMIPGGWRICGENLYAKHSIHYTKLKAYFMVYSVWDDHNNALSWDKTKQFCAKLGLTTVPVFYEGSWSHDDIQHTYSAILYEEEGYVVRCEKSFSFEDFDINVAKYVRKGHVQTDEHWMNQKVIPNLLKG